jgi:hypothetical protein
MNQRAVGTDGAFVLVRGFQHHFDGTADAHTETGGFGDEDFHGNGRISTGAGPGRVNAPPTETIPGKNDDKGMDLTGKGCQAVALR